MVPESATQVDLSTVPPIGWIASGILLFNIRRPGDKKEISKEAENALNLIEETRRRGISDDELKMVYKLSCISATKNIGLNKELEAEVEKLKRQEASGG